jgi:hypothetical protein
LLVIATSRDTAPELDAALAHWLGALARVPSCTLVGLRGLDEEATAQLIAEVGGSAGVSETVRITGGNPLFVRELATAEPRRTLHALVTDRFARMEPGDEDIVDIGAVIGESFRAGLVAEATGPPLQEVIDALERAERAGLVRSMREQPGRCAFVHAVFRSVRYDALTTGRRVRLHALVARALEPHADDPRVLPELARHAYLSASSETAGAAASLCLRAGAMALAAADHGNALDHFRHGLDVIDLGSERDERLRLELLLRLGAALTVVKKSEGHEVLRAAAAQARALDDATGLARAACAMHGWAGMLSPEEADTPFIALAEEALHRLPADEATWRPRVLALLGAHLRLAGAPERGLELAREAEAATRSTDDPTTRVQVLLPLRYSLGPFELDERAGYFAEAYELATRTGDADAAKVAADAMARCDRERGDLVGARAWRARADALGSPNVAGLHDETADAILRGDLDLASKLARECHTMAAEVGMESQYGAPLRILIEALKGNMRTEPFERAAASRGFFRPLATALLAVALARADRPASAANLLSKEIEAGLERLPSLPGWTVTMTAWAEVAHLVDDRPAASQVLRYLEPFAGQLATSTMPWGSIDHGRAQCLLTLDDADAATRVAEEAAAASRSRGTPIVLGRELVALAVARRSLGAPEREIDQLVADATRIAVDTGALLITNEASRYGLLRGHAAKRLDS